MYSKQHSRRVDIVVVPDRYEQYLCQKHHGGGGGMQDVSPRLPR